MSSGPPVTPTQPPGALPPRQNKGSNALLMGCGIVFVLFLFVAGFGIWVAFHFVSGALHTAQDVAQIAKGAASGAQQTGGQPGATPNPLDVLKGMVGGGKGHIETVPREELKGYLPASVGSLARSTVEASSGTYAGITGTSATANYGDSQSGTVQIVLTDAANMTGLTAMMDLLMGSVQTESDSGFQKTIDLGDVKVHEKWLSAGKNADLIGVVGGRFVIGVTSRGVEITTAEQAFQAVDIAKLTSIAASTQH